MYKKLIIFLTLMFFPLSSFAIFHDERTNYFFQNKQTNEIKYFSIARDFDAWFFNYSIRDYLYWKNFNDNTFDNWNFIEFNHCNRWRCEYWNTWKYNNFSYENTNTWSSLSTKNLNYFTKSDLTNKELFNIYYRYIILNYLKEFFKYLIFNLVVFYPFWYLILKKFSIKNRKILKIFILSFIFYIISDVLLYSFWFWYIQFSKNLFWEYIYWMSVWFLKLFSFVFWIILFWKDFKTFLKDRNLVRFFKFSKKDFKG